MSATNALFDMQTELLSAVNKTKMTLIGSFSVKKMRQLLNETLYGLSYEKLN